MNNFFGRLARQSAIALGTPLAFFISLAIVIVWVITGPVFHYSDTWQLVINTGTTIITYLMIFLVQNTQNHDSKALHLKLDELLRAVGEARNSLINLETMTDEDLLKLEEEFEQIRAVEEGHALHPVYEQIQKIQELRGTQG